MSMDYGSPFFQKPWVKVKDGGGVAIPPFAVLRIASVARDTTTGEIIYTVGQPNTTFYRLYLVNGPMEIAASGYGWATFLGNGGLVLYDTGTPALGEVWGPKSGQWGLTKWRYGFEILGQHSSTDLLAHAIQSPVNSVYGQTNGAINKGSSGTVDLYDGNNAAITSTSVTATNRFANVATTKKVLCEIIGGTWLLSAAEC